MSQVRHADHIINFELLQGASAAMGRFQKRAFVPGGDVAGGGGAPPGGAPPMDPSMGGGDPAAMGMDPSMMGGGGAPPPAPAGGGGGGGDPILQQILQKLTMLEPAGGAGGAGGAAGGIKPKVDVNAVLLQILKILARIADSLGVQIPASEMVPGQQDMQQLAQATTQGTAMPGMDPTAQAGGAGGAGAIPPIPPMQGSGVPGGEKVGTYREPGDAFDTSRLADLGSRAATVASMLKARKDVA